MARPDRAEPNTVAWVDVQTPDLQKARAFYGELLGWSFAGGEDANTGFYTMAQLHGRNVAGMAKLSDKSPFPPAWSVYIGVENVDAVVEKVKGAGGNVLVGPMDVMEEGRMAFFTDPTGAHLGLWQSKKHKGAQIVDEPGAMCWHEVYTRDLAKARAFYEKVFGWQVKKLDAPGIDYCTMHQGDRTVGGLMQMGSQFPASVPSHWNTYFAVADTDAATKKLSALGGKVMQPAFDTPYGRMAAVADPFGAAFCLIKPSRDTK